MFDGRMGFYIYCHAQRASTDAIVTYYCGLWHAVPLLKLLLQAQTEASAETLKAAADLADSKACEAELCVQLRESVDKAEALEQQLQVSLINPEVLRNVSSVLVLPQLTRAADDRQLRVTYIQTASC